MRPLQVGLPTPDSTWSVGKGVTTDEPPPDSRRIDAMASVHLANNVDNVGKNVFIRHSGRE